MFIRCPYCGIEINTDDRSCQKECPLGKDCRMICCPNCRYSFVIPQSSLIDAVKKIFRKGKGK